mmetsp:Transcript_14513/g.16226  ORF Transcript_14513/g.16226 Transcript_14513/m.16226 type:complete len:389 (-) Transcript_14513:13-1179(-)|eukprot:CAMPEP_0205828180 /NCGR_PEP_ID=MMETSP0206-20130828/34290_1 /ASSEMBLY_ACC=CAM_ASM_000279 /TAXON_ID=36767 /ORGANISM="Euplotes focardii, Strain TN1" /LENGTH=388 /DNA_ID=CAMNT_0053129733 /DNA_START=25 /DNA_END=1191 /DNA_ORIENTATION=+
MSDTEMMDDAADMTVPNLSNPEVVDKFKAAADVANRALAVVVQAAVPGAVVVDLCALGDSTITTMAEGVYAKMKVERGIAFPTCISPNNICGHYSPLASDRSAVLKEGDLVKVDLGAHVDGLIATAAHSFVCTANPQQQFTGPIADVICAAHFAGECALRMCRPGKTSEEISQVIQDVAAVFGCNALEGVSSRRMLRNDLLGDKAIVNKPSKDQKVDHIVIEENEVYSIDIIMSTGTGESKDSEERANVYRRTSEQVLLKMKASRALLGEATRKFGDHAFSLRAFDDENKALLGLKECVANRLLDPFPVFYEREGVLTAQFKFTVLILKGSIQRITAHPLPFVSSEHSITEPRLLSILQMGTKRKNANKKKRRNKKAPAAADKMEVDQ